MVWGKWFRVWGLPWPRLSHCSMASVSHTTWKRERKSERKRDDLCHCPAPKAAIHEVSDGEREGYLDLHLRD